MLINLERFYPPTDAKLLLDAYSKTMPSGTMKECDVLQGQVSLIV